jgi:ribonuclease P protein component
LIEPLRGRAAFADLRADGRTVRRGPVGVVYRPASAQQTRVAYAIGRPVGTAVVRNRVRRRLRHLLAELTVDELPPGDYLFRIAPEAAMLNHQELTSTVMRALDALRAAP